MRECLDLITEPTKMKISEMSSSNIIVVLIVCVALLTTCSGGHTPVQTEDQFLSRLESTQTPRLRANSLVVEPYEEQRGDYQKTGTELSSDQLIPRPLLRSEYYNNLTPMKRRRPSKRYQRLSPWSVSRSQWLASIHPLSHNQRITSNNFENTDFENNHLNNELSDDNSNSLLPARHIRRVKQSSLTQSSTSGTKSSKSSQQMPIRPMATISRGTRGARQYDIPQIGK